MDTDKYSNDARWPHKRIFYLPTNEKYECLKIKRQKRNCVRKTAQANVIRCKSNLMT
jgi:hypothetical protein